MPFPGATGLALRCSVPLSGRGLGEGGKTQHRPRRTAVTATSSPLFTSVFSSLITGFIAFAWGKPGDSGAGEDPLRNAPAALRSAPPWAGEEGTHGAQPGLPPPSRVASRISGGEGRSRSPGADGTRRCLGSGESLGAGGGRGQPMGRCLQAHSRGPASSCCTSAAEEHIDGIDGFPSEQRR